MILPNIDVFVRVFGGQFVAALNASGRKTKTGKANGQTVRGLPNMVLTAPDGKHFFLQGMVCTLNGWNDIHLSTSAPEGFTVNKHGVVPFDWKGETGTDARCDAMRKFCEEVCIRTDAASAWHFEEAVKVPAAKASKAPTMDAMAALGF